MHSWFKYCINKQDFDGARSLSHFVKALAKQAKLPAATVPYREDLPQQADPEEEFKAEGFLAPVYFGAGVEAFAETYFEEFGMARHNISNYMSQDSVEEDQEDTGYDATATTVRTRQYGTMIKKIAKAGSPVYVQVKGRVDPTSEHYTNDGSRIMNFYANAQSHARMRGESYSARYILFTTGRDLHWRLARNVHEEIETVNYRIINNLIKNNTAFWNAFRRKIGLPVLHDAGPKDPDWTTMQAQIDLENGIDAGDDE